MSRERLRDPIHGLIVFDVDNDNTDKIAWNLIQTPEFQRLRRIKQLGVSEFTFPGATHSRFIHSIGVYHNARRLMKAVMRERKGEVDRDLSRVTLIGALLHDLGHGPFSHSFENARKELANGAKIHNHEWFTEQMIRDPEGSIVSILGQDLASKVADLFVPDDPQNIYHAILTSSFDADRLDYLVRDRYMTGVQTGAIDTDWLIDNLSIHQIYPSQDGEELETDTPTETFSFKEKGRQAAEDFLLARYRQFSQVYLHKTTRGFECAISALIRRIGMAAREGASKSIGIEMNHPLVEFLSDEVGSLADYRRLDDTVAWSAIEILTHSKEPKVAELAKRIWHRTRLKCLDLNSRCPGVGPLGNAQNQLDQAFSDELDETVFKDSPKFNLYSSMSGDETKAHKIVRINVGDGQAREITEFEDTVIGETLQSNKWLVRYYFLNDSDHVKAEKILSQGG